MTILNSTKSVNDLKNEFGEFFKQNESPSFMNLLWQYIVNEVNAEKDLVFSAAYTKNNRLELIVVENGETGYYPTHVGFADGVDYSQAVDIAEKLSEKIFGSISERTIAIVLGSMGKKKHTNKPAKYLTSENN